MGPASAGMLGLGAGLRGGRGSVFFVSEASSGAADVNTSSSLSEARDAG